MLLGDEILKNMGGKRNFQHAWEVSSAIQGEITLHHQAEVSSQVTNKERNSCYSIN